MNDFRKRVLSGKPLRDPLLRSKGQSRQSKGQEPDVPTGAHPEGPDEASLDRLLIPRDASRTTDHRDGDRHRLQRDEGAVASWNGGDYPVQIINLSGGGAMISAAFQPRLWDRVDLSLGGCGQLECAVRWVKDGRLGLEFAHETRIDADVEVRTALLREVVRRSFPHAELAASPPSTSPEPEQVPAPSAAEAVERGEKRHPLVWTGQVHFNHESTDVRLRNVSAVGALVEADKAFPVGSEILLDLGEAGSIFSTVAWTHGDQSGLRFHAPFNLALLARSKPEVAPARWAKPDYLRDDSTESSPWASRWNRLTVSELRDTLGR